ncbi:cell division protein FtsQ/DivIB [Gephyromycinifex aptenodytis]|uniref:cell division protein FtsQ/DivIB n=1 Tax=Gephyromycinifex aptenodytis TaxID=2716227 RepID=UPI001447282E|nr:FtsQ-type POTRA domain-containing protein [Gephyromycinifex aptenodytis]
MTASRFRARTGSGRVTSGAAGVRRRVPWRQLLAVLLIAGAVAAAFFGLFWYAPFLRIADVAIEGARPQQQPGIQRAADITLGEPLVEVDTKAVAARVMATKLFSEVQVQRSWPDTVTITATPREPVLALQAEAGQVWLVDDSGVAYEEVTHAPDDLPLATSDQGLNETASAALARVASSLRTDLRAATRDLHIDAESRVSLQVKETEVFWGESEDSRLKAAVVTRLLDTAGVGYIDVSAPMAPVTAEHRPQRGERPPESAGSAASAGPSDASTEVPRSSQGATPESPEQPTPSTEPRSASATSIPG